MKPVLFGILVLALLVLSGMVMAGEQPCQAVTPINDYANIRREPQVGDNIIGRLNRGETACVIGMPGGWYHLDRGGYISASVVIFATVTPMGPTPTRMVTPTKTISGQANTPTPTTAPTATPTILRVCIIFGAERDEICSVFLEPVTVRVERLP